MNNERLKIAFPKGELQRDVEKFMTFAGLEFSPIDRCWKIPVQNMPLDFIITRASDVPTVIDSEKFNTPVGITGSDILWEAGFGNKYGEEIPVYQAVPDSKQSRLYTGGIDPFLEELRRQGTVFPDSADLEGQIVATKLTRITQEYFDKLGIPIQIFPVNGNVEAVQYYYPECVGVVDVISSGRTLRENRITPLDIFYDVTVRLIEAKEGIGQRSKNILDDLREKITVAMQRKRMVS